MPNIELDNAPDWLFKREEEKSIEAKAQEFLSNPTNPNTLLLTECSYLWYIG